MNRPALVLLFTAVLTGLAAAPAAAEGRVATETHDTICVKHTFPNGTSTPNICVPNPL